MQAIWNHSAASGTALLVLLAIGDYANDGGVAWPKVETLAKKARCTERQVQKVLRQLVAAQELAVEEKAGPRGTNRYRVLVSGLDGGAGWGEKNSGEKNA